MNQKKTTQHIKKIVEESVKKVLREYRFKDTEEILEYLWLRPSITKLRVDLFVDDGGSYKRHGHRLFVLARNGYDKSVSEFIPFEVSQNARILDSKISYHISYDDIFAIQDFIVMNAKVLRMLANREIGHELFMHSIKVPSYVLREGNAHLLLEMATLRKEESSLPMDIWLDEGGTYHGHAPRLKFRASREQRTTREYSSMLLTNPPTIENMPRNSPLKSEDIEALKMFVVNHLEDLLLLANGEIDYTSEFLPRIRGESEKQQD